MKKQIPQRTYGHFVTLPLLVLIGCIPLDIAPIVDSVALRPNINGVFAETAVNGSFRTGRIGLMWYNWTRDESPAPISSDPPFMGATRGSLSLRDVGRTTHSVYRTSVNGDMQGWSSLISSPPTGQPWTGFAIELDPDLLYGATGGWREIPNVPIGDQPPVITTIGFCQRTMGSGNSITACIPWFAAVMFGTIECIHYFPPTSVGGDPTNPLHGTQIDPIECTRLRLVPSYSWIAIQGLTTWPLEE